jgi:hypothetical protein
MKKNRHNLTATLLVTAMFFTTACETGIKNKKTEQLEAPSGIVDKLDNNCYTSNSNGLVKKSLVKRIFSKSATPGYYLQVGFFQNYKPNATFMSRINHSGMPYTILLKNGNYHALVGPYTSYNQAKSKKSDIRESLTKEPFVVEVLRP